MPWPADRPKGLVRHLATLLLYVVVAAYVLGVFMATWGFRGDDPAYGFDAMVDGTASRPFCYRVLSPAIIRAIADLLPAGWVAHHRRWFMADSPILRFREEGERWDLTKAVRWHVAYGYLFLCLVTLLFVGRRLVGRCLPEARAAPVLAPPLCLLFLPLTFCYGGYLYDFPELLLLATFLLVVHEGRWWAICPVFVMAVLNKEADVVALTYLVALGTERMPRRLLLVRLVLLTVLAAAALLSIHALYMHLPGSPLRLHLVENLRFWTSAEPYVATFSPISPLIRLPRAGNLLSLISVAAVIVFAWRDLPSGFRRLTAIVLPIEVCLLLVLGHRDEVRALAPAFPVLALSGLYAARRLFGLIPDPAREL